MDLELKKIDWEQTKRENINLIIMNKMQIEMALNVIELCYKKIKSFPEEKEKKKENPIIR